ncbi:helix-turn-helix domain-containing protein [Roseivirga sp. UBA1976]|uniref:helix-turn-helix domain-containing protein n=1 Tax=Roseivirga sp. UBA1976 TaxID=1947386 RepID=UPI00257DF033|nr:helix-turn-helix domain-containing protein [Roseivirga sp. UBA1976]MEC7754535.1 helix-turn-helix domain-containing protein [Bacteroidota bacterium]|tara:strand:+ start:1440 stop:1724 length:285 start_codon:yes stop_codon:yes gene_type:complete
MSNQNNELNIKVAFSDEKVDALLNQVAELYSLVKKIPHKDELPKMLTSEEVMETLNIKRWKFDQLIADGEIEYIRKGRKIYVPESSIRQYFGME